MITVSSILLFMMVKFSRNGNQNAQESVKNVLLDTILTRTTNVLVYQLVALMLTSTENALNARLVMNLTQRENVSFPFQTQMTTVPNTNSLIQMVNGTTDHSEVARRSAKFVTQDINSTLKENVLKSILTVPNTTEQSVRNVPKATILTDTTDVLSCQLDVLLPKKMETVLNARRDMNSTKMTFVSFLFQAQVTTVPSINTLITLAHGTAPAD